MISPLLTGCCFIGTAILLIYSLNLYQGETVCRNLTFSQAFIIGCFQAVAILPGFSRSGFTIVGGLYCKLRREEAATFSFLLAIPVIGGKGFLEVIQLFRHADEHPSGDLAIIGIGMLVSFIVGLISLLWVLQWLKGGKLYYFAFWLFLLGPIVVYLSLFHPVAATPAQSTPDATPVSTTESTTESALESAPVSVPKSTSESASESAPVSVPEEGSVLSTDNLQDSQPVVSPEKNTLVSPEKNTAVSSVPEFAESENGDSSANRFSAEIDEEPEPAPVSRVPLFDCPNERLLSLDDRDPLWITRDRKSVVLVGSVCLREGFLELFACRSGSKEHESIVALDVKPFMIHAALLVVGAEPGSPAKYRPTFVPPQGERIDIRLRWRDADAVLHECDVQDWILESGGETKPETNDAGIAKNDAVPETPVPVSQGIPMRKMSVPFVFTGSFFREVEDEDGKTHQIYMSDATGELIGLSNFPASILDVPIRSSDANEELLFQANPERIPPLGTMITLILTPNGETEG